MAAISVALRAAAASGGGGALAGAAEGGAAGGALSQMNGEIANTAKEANVAGSAFGDLKGMLGKVVGETNLFMIGLGAVGKAFDQVNEVLGQVTALTNKYVKAFAPAEAELFNNALKDMNAVIGEQLVPVTRAARDVIRWFADTFATFTPVVRSFIEDVISAVKPTFEKLGQAFDSALTRIMPLVKLIGEVLVVAIHAVLLPINLVIDAFTYLSEAVNDFLGLQKVAIGDSRGKAAARGQISDVQGVLSRAQASAFGLGREDPQKQSASYLKLIYEYFNEGKLAKQIVDAIKNAPAKAAGAAAARVAGNGNPIGGPADMGQFWGRKAAELLIGIPRFDQG